MYQILVQPKINISMAWALSSCSSLPWWEVETTQKKEEFQDVFSLSIGRKSWQNSTLCVFFFCSQSSISTDLEHAYLSAVDQYHLTSNSKRWTPLQLSWVSVDKMSWCGCGFLLALFDVLVFACCLVGEGSSEHKSASVFCSVRLEVITVQCFTWEES